MMMSSQPLNIGRGRRAKKKAKKKAKKAKSTYPAPWRWLESLPPLLRVRALATRDEVATTVIINLANDQNHSSVTHRIMDIESFRMFTKEVGTNIVGSKRMRSTKKAKKRKPSRLTHEMAMREKDIIINKRIKEMGEDEEIKAMSYTLLPRKKRELYKAMQLGLAKKEARVNELKERAKKLKKDGVMDEKGRLIPAAADAAPAKKTKKKK